MKNILNLSIFAVAAAVSLPLHAQTQSKPNARVLSLCEAVDNRKALHRQKILVRAVLASGPEMSWLYDPECQGGKDLVDVEFSKPVNGQFEKLNRILSNRKHALVVVEGLFYGPEPYDNIDPNIPQGVQERLKKASRRYGHLDAFENMIEVSKVIDVTKMEGSGERDVPLKKTQVKRQAGSAEK
jgi:hypothetical protein